MILRSIVLTSISLIFTGAIAHSQSVSWKYAGITDDLSNATVSVLGKLGYDCQTLSVGGILCKKCQLEDNKQKCDAFICDAVTKKCRRKSAEIPQLPFGD